MTTHQAGTTILLDRLIDDHTLFRGLLAEALERLEASQPPKGFGSTEARAETDQLCQRIRKALKGRIAGYAINNQ